MGSSGLPKIFVDSEAELPAASKWNDNFSFLNLSPGNHIRNGDFEQGFSGGVPDRWALVGTGAVSAVDADSKRAVNAVKVTFGSADSYLKQTAVEIKFFKGRTMKAWCWVKTSAPNQARIKVSDGVGSSASAYHTGSGVYELLAVTHAVAAGATTIDIELHVESVGSALFDAAVLVDFEEIRGFVPFLAQGGVGDFLTITVSDNAPATPDANTLYRDLLPKAWVKFQGASGTIDDDVNVASVVRTSTGVYTVTFARAFASINYVMTGNTFDTTAGDVGMVRLGPGAPLVGSCQIQVHRDNGAVADFDNVMLLFFGRQ